MNTVDQQDGKVLSRQYSEVSKRCMQLLMLSRPLTCDDILHVLSSLPQPKNERRISVIPSGHTFVHSQAAGLTTQQGLKPCIANICTRCPQVVRVLSLFAIQHDPFFEFTTVTINYNYAAAPHRDVNHEENKARIIALGNFTGGELQVEGFDQPVNIRNVWFDFDGSLLHQTLPFSGERYSLVYFTHLAHKQVECGALIPKFVSLGIPWPGTIATSRESLLKMSSIEDRQDEDPTTLQKFLFIPNISCPQYLNSVSAEISSLLWLNGITDLCSCEEIDNCNAFLSPGRLVTIPSLPAIIQRISIISSRAVSFLTLHVIFTGNSVESLEAATKYFPLTSMSNYMVDLISIGRQISTRQKRKVMTASGLFPPICFDRSCCSRLCIVLVHEAGAKDEFGSAGVLRKVLLCTCVNAQECHNENFTSGDAITDREEQVPNMTQGNSFESKGPPSTALRQKHCELICNLAGVRKFSLCFDPFVGSGCLLNSVTHFGGIGIGADAAIDAVSSSSNELRHIFVANLYHNMISENVKFDAIICDPPYGRRERHVNALGIDTFLHDSNTARAISHVQILTPLLRQAAAHLRTGCRIVFLFANFPESAEAHWNALDVLRGAFKDSDSYGELPLKLLHVCKELRTFSTGHLFERDIVVMERTSVQFIIS